MESRCAMIFSIIKKESLIFLLLNYTSSKGERLEYKDSTWWISGYIKERNIESSIKANRPISLMESLTISYKNTLVFNHKTPVIIHNTRVDTSNVLFEPGDWLDAYQSFIKDKKKYNLFNQMK